MRISLIGPTFPYRGGIAQHTTWLVRALREAGHEVQFLSFKRQYPEWLYGRSDRDPSQTPLKEPVDYRLDSINPMTWWQTARDVVAFAPHLVLIPWWVPFWTPHVALIKRIIRSNLPEAKLVFVCHNVFPHEAGRLDRSLAKFALGQADGYIVHAQSEAQKLVELFPDRLHLDQDILVAPMPTFVLSSRPAEHLQEPDWLGEIDDDLPIILFCGIVRKYKGLDLLIEAMPDVLADIPVHLVIAGEFWEDEGQFTEQIERLNLAPHVTVNNQFLPNGTLSALVKRAELVVLPYRSATQSAVIQLAFGLETPVIATDVGGIREVVQDGKNGYLVPAENPVALSNAIKRYFQTQQRENFVHFIRAEAEKFSWKRFAKTIGRTFLNLEEGRE